MKSDARHNALKLFDKMVADQLIKNQLPVQCGAIKSRPRVTGGGIPRQRLTPLSVRPVHVFGVTV